MRQQRMLTVHDHTTRTEYNRGVVRNWIER
jgi:hypothetical protein